MKLVDLKLDTNPVHLENLSKLTKWIEDNEDHRNKNNYINLESMVPEFDSFELLYDDDKIVAFSGLHSKNYANEYSKNAIARACTRTYYHPDYRCKGLNRARWSEKYFVPYELQVAKNKKHDYVFISIELLMRRRSMEDSVNYLNSNYFFRYCTTIHKWILHPDMCNTCRVYNNHGKYIGTTTDVKCWQNVCYTKISDTLLPFEELPRMSITTYKSQYNNDQLDRIKKLK